MTNVVESIRQCVAESLAKGHAWMVLSVGPRAPRTGSRSFEGVKVAPGLFGSLRGENVRPDGLLDYIVEVSVVDAQAWLKRRGIVVGLAPDLAATAALWQNLAVAGALHAARLGGILYCDGDVRWRPGCGRVHSIVAEPDQTAERIGLHEMVGEIDCERCGEGGQHYLHTDRDDEPALGEEPSR